MLRQLTPNRHPDLLVGTETYDDAGVFRLRDDLAIVQTVDFFPPLVDDPYLFGQIAAANALSDVYAMGGEPLTALAIAGFPDKDAELAWLVEILRGGADKVHEAGALIVGGHTIRDAEIKYGLAVTGRIHPERILTNAAARPGDRLVLTKPIGSGVLTTAAKAEKIGPDQLRQATEIMCALNAGAARAALRVGVNACTDVTGFGLIGHAFEMASGSGVTISLRASRVPLLDRALELARLGMLTRAHKSTQANLGPRLSVDPAIEPALAGVLLDAQTSGGLLISVPADRVSALLRELAAEKTSCAAEIGAVEPAGGAAIRLTP